MESRPLGPSGLRVSVLAFGTGAMGENSTNHEIDDREAIAAIHHAIDAGCNLIDTAPNYNDGYAEELVGKAILGLRSNVLIATKCGAGWPRTGEPYASRSPGAFDPIRECEKSLRRLRVEVIDLYQCYRPAPPTSIRGTMEALQTLRAHGKIRAVGLCDFSCEEIAAAREFGVIDAVQAGFSILQRRAADDLLPYCVEHRIGVLAYSPLARGLLTGRLTTELRFSGLRGSDPDFVGDRYRRNLRIVDGLRAVADPPGKTVSQLAVNWVISQPGVAAAIVGMHRPSQVDDVLGGLGWELSEADRAKIGRILQGELRES